MTRDIAESNHHVTLVDRCDVAIIAPHAIDRDILDVDMNPVVGDRLGKQALMNALGQPEIVIGCTLLS